MKPIVIRPSTRRLVNALSARVLQLEDDLTTSSSARKMAEYALARVNEELHAVGIIPSGAAGVRELWLRYTSLLDQVNQERAARAGALLAEHSVADAHPAGWSYRCECHRGYTWRLYPGGIRAVHDVSSALLLDGAKVNPLPQSYQDPALLEKVHPRAEE